MIKNLLRPFIISTIVLISSNSVFAQSNSVKVTDFSVSTKAQKVMIGWKTDGTTATNYFAIQKSTDGINFKTVALVLGPDPKQKDCDCYACSDKYLPNSSKQSYYRLVHIDANGNEQITEAKVLATP